MTSYLNVVLTVFLQFQDLTRKARSLEKDSHKALAAATEQDVRNEELKRDLEKMMQEAVARKKKQEVLAREYKAEVIQS